MPGRNEASSVAFVSISWECCGRALLANLVALVYVDFWHITISTTWLDAMLAAGSGGFTVTLESGFTVSMDFVLTLVTRRR